MLPSKGLPEVKCSFPCLSFHINFHKVYNVDNLDSVKTADTVDTVKFVDIVNTVDIVYTADTGGLCRGWMDGTDGSYPLDCDEYTGCSKKTHLQNHHPVS